jgi:hypothetical protein
MTVISIYPRSSFSSQSSLAAASQVSLAGQPAFGRKGDGIAAMLNGMVMKANISAVITLSFAYAEEIPAAEMLYIAIKAEVLPAKMFANVIEDDVSATTTSASATGEKVSVSDTLRDGTVDVVLAADTFTRATMAEVSAAKMKRMLLNLIDIN